MDLRTTLIATASTTMAAAASATVWWTLTSENAPAPTGGAPAPRSSSASAPSENSDDHIVCVGPDRVLRAPAGESCPPNHKELNLEEEDDERLCELCDPFQEPRRDPGGDQALAALEQRIRALENAAYFEVVTKDGRPIFRVAPGGVRVYNKSGMAVAGIGATEAGGFFNARSATSPVEASIGASQMQAGVRVMEEGLLLLDLMTKEGVSSLRVPSGNGMIAGIGASRAGTGALLVGTLGGQVKATFTVENERGLVQVSKEQNSGGLSMLEAGIGGGLLDIAVQGNSAVKMGQNGRYGLVLAGPVLGLPLVPKSGLPGSYFLGCAGEAPPACAPVVP
jgi:hypothetical protein